MNLLPTLPIFCTACEQKVYILVARLKDGTAKCSCGAPMNNMTPEFAAFVRRITARRPAP